MIVTLNECKTFLQISDSSKDSLIKALIPIVESNIVNYCNNEFIGRYETINGVLPIVYSYSNTISFQNSDNSINDTENIDFTNTNFKVGDSIRIYNSINNDKPLTISSISSDKIIVEDVNTVNDEIKGNTIVIARIDYPASLKLVASQMIKYNLNKRANIYKSEKIDDYSYSNFNIAAGYPLSIMSQIDEYRSAFLKTIPYNTLYYRQV